MIGKHFSQVDECLSLVSKDTIERAIVLLDLTRHAAGTVWVAGNGGSAATASHFANDLTKIGKVNAIAICDMIPTILAYGNDDGWDRMFANPLLKYMKPMDCIVGISCSGNSDNVVEFIRAAGGRRVIGMTGPSPSKMSLLIADPNVLIRAMSDEITVQEDVHSIVCHAIARSLHG